MEPLTLVGSLGFAFARGLAGRAGSRLLPANDVGLRLSSIEAKLATMTADAHREPLRQGISLLRHAITTGDSRDRARRRSAAEDHLLVAADDTRLTPDDRAAAAILLATSFADREDQDRATQWLWQAQGFLAFFVNDRLHFADAIMSDAAPRWVVEDLDKQRKAAGVVARLRTFHPRTSHLRQALVDQARSVLPVWENVRGVLDATESGLYFPTPTIASRYRGSFVAAEDEPLKLVMTQHILGDDHSEVAPRPLPWRPGALGHTRTGVLRGGGSVNGDAYSWHAETRQDFELEPCGIQVLTNRHLDRPAGLLQWVITQVDDKHYMVEAPRPITSRRNSEALPSDVGPPYPSGDTCGVTWSAEQRLSVTIVRGAPTSSGVSSALDQRDR